MKIQVKGIQELQKKLNSQEIKRLISKGVVRAAERYTQEIDKYIDAGKSFTPRTGFLQNSIGWRLLGKYQAKVFANAKYASFIEYGTHAHKIKPKRRKALRWEEEGQYFFAKSVWHPGSKEYPFFYADFDNRKKAVAREFIETIEEFLDG